jgi:hypothetical protein
MFLFVVPWFPKIEFALRGGHGESFGAHAAELCFFWIRAMVTNEVPNVGPFAFAVLAREEMGF